jgi:hypothetical protein
MVPPLLADLTRHALANRVELSIIAEIHDPAVAAVRLSELAPDVVILGPSAIARRLDPAQIRLLLPRAHVLAVSADLAHVFGPGEDDVNELTAEALVRCLPVSSTGRI